MSRPDDAWRVEIEAQRGVLLVKTTGRLYSFSDARELQIAVEQAAVESSARRVIFDNRETLPVEAHVGQAMRSWHYRCGLFDRVAMLFQSVERQRTVNLAAASAGALIRAFRDFDLARTWVAREDWIVRNLLVFDFQNIGYAVDALSVNEVLPWQPPLQLIGLPPAALGVIEHRGKMRVVCHPGGVAGADADGTRLIVCDDRWCDLALPATNTYVATGVELDQTPVHAVEFDSNFGTLRYIDPRKLRDELTLTARDC